MYANSVTRRRGQGSSTKEELVPANTSLTSFQDFNFSHRATVGTSLNESLTPRDLSRNSSSSSLNRSEFVQSDMPSSDRTAEFKATAKSLQMKIQGNGHVSRKHGPKKTVEETLEFNRQAKRVGHDLSNTCAKLEKLALLAKSKSLFDDRMGEIDELTHVIKQDISSLNQQIARLQDVANNNFGAGSKTHVHSHSRTIVVSLQSKLANVSNEFKQVLEVRTENMKEQRTRRAQFSHSQTVPSNLPPSASTGHLGSVLMQDEEASRNSDVAIPMDVMERNRFDKQMQLIDQQDVYIQSRANTMQNIESTIVELGTIFQQLATMVQEQGEMVQRIDQNVEHTVGNIEAAHMELLKYFHSISQNRWLAIKVFGVLILFFVIFVVFLV